MIKSFADKTTAAIFKGLKPKKVPADVYGRARRKIKMLHSAHSLDDLKNPPANRLEKLTGDREGQYSIRINKQWRYCFNFIEGHCENVEFTDYH